MGVLKADLPSIQALSLVFQGIQQQHPNNPPTARLTMKKRMRLNFSSVTEKNAPISESRLTKTMLAKL